MAKATLTLETAAAMPGAACATADIHLALRGVSHTYPARAAQGPVPALGPLDLELRRGEFFWRRRAFGLRQVARCSRSSRACPRRPRVGAVRGKPADQRQRARRRRRRVPGGCDASPGSPCGTTSPSACVGPAPTARKSRAGSTQALAFMGLTGFRRRLSGATVRRHAPARLHRAHAGAAAAPDPPRRAVRRARPADAAADGRRAAAAVARDRRHDAADHACAGRGGACCPTASA